MRDNINRAVGSVLFNVSNYPARAQRHMIGQDFSDLREKVVEAVMESLSEEGAVQVPVSLTTQARAVVESEVDATWVFRAQAVLRALLSQPTPTADAHCTGDEGCTAPTHVHGCFADRGNCTWPDEHEPPRIEDMAPGTRFLANARGWTNASRWVVTQDAGGSVVAHSTDSWQWVAQADIDPSTIRDVTPPKE